MRKTVYIYKTSPDKLRKDIEKVVRVTGLLKKYKPDKETLIKINGNCDKYYPGSNTSPWFLDAFLSVLKKYGFGNIKVIEGDLFEFTVEEMLTRTFLGEVVKKRKVEYINYEKLPRDKDMLPKILRGKQLINIPVVHTHGFAKISVATKNFYGLYPVTRRHMHKMLNEKLLLIYKKFPFYTIVDGTVGLVGDSTRTGIPRPLDMILAGWDTLAIDRIATRLMGYSEEEIPLLAKARENKILPDVLLKGDYGLQSLPKENFQYEDTTERKVTRWLEGLDNPNPVNTITSYILHFAGIDWFYNRIRMVYNNRQFEKKKSRIFNGPWTKYEKNTSYINYSRGR